MTLFGGEHIPWKRAVPALSVKLAAEDAPQQDNAPPDGLRTFRRWNNRPVQTRGIVVGATPATVGAAINSADGGDPSDLFNLLFEMLERNPQITADLGVRKRAVAQTGWRLVPASEDPEDVEVAERITALVKQISNLETGLVYLLSSIAYGIGACELDWQMKPHPEQAGRQVAVVKQFLYRPQRHLLPSNNDPFTWRYRSTENLIDGEEMTENRWVVHFAAAKDGYPVQAGLGRILLWFALFAHYAIKDWAAYSEMYGSPMRVGKGAPGSTAGQMQDVADALAQLGVDAYAVLPPNWDVEFIGDKGNKSGPEVYEKLLSYVNKGFSRLILGQTLTSDVGDVGSYGAAAVHNGVRMDIARADATQLASTLTEQLIRPLVLFNEAREDGSTPACPTWEFLMEPPKDPRAEAEAQSSRADVYQKARDAGLPVSVAQMRADLNLHEPTGDDDVLGGGGSDDTDTDTDTDEGDDA